MDDTKFIYTLDVKDLHSTSLKQLVDTILVPTLGAQLLIEFNSNIVYEQGEDVDEDD